ncbi:hypothetical protein G9G63_25770 [Paenibacillus sp. EKM202P]|uniref:Pycsar system effector family protein n=1 Tax=unclassified Paenibacillus TaxID=185978 RepID=UPI0013EA7B27|nr:MULTISPECIES: Pycsar system effector family protein [unclassified Paenibacillus]KAF6558339.1 hypothetical protein G9G63_25770 [Paenibacillus sp. EKM202P]KAF6563273.1 hypothetical protein G9G64_25660 [Paenibacillus sp. EKM207P]
MESENYVNRTDLLARLDRLLDWIKSCDTKASIVIAGIGLFLTLFTSENFFSILKAILTGAFSHLNFSNLLFLICFALAFSLFVYGSYCLIRVLAPRLSSDVEIMEGMHTDSLYFFESISKNNFREFAEKVRGRNEADDINDILSQLYINAKICTVKYTYYSKGIRYGAIGLSTLLILFILGVILSKAGGFQ